MTECCATTGELRSMMEDIAKKAAEEAANRAIERSTAHFSNEMLSLKMELKDEIRSEFENGMRSWLGMTAQEHAIAHDKMRSLDEFFRSVSLGVWKKVLISLAIAGFVLAGSAVVGHSGSISKMLESNQHAIKKEHQTEQPSHEIHKKLQ